MSGTQNETFASIQAGEKTFQRFTTQNHDGILLDMQINVSPAKPLIIKQPCSGYGWRLHTGA